MNFYNLSGKITIVPSIFLQFDYSSKEDVIIVYITSDKYDLTNAPIEIYSEGSLVQPERSLYYVLELDKHYGVYFNNVFKFMLPEIKKLEGNFEPTYHSLPLLQPFPPTYKYTPFFPEQSCEQPPQ